MENDPLLSLYSSERINKDVECLMNSQFWIEALRARKATGIGRQLQSELIESQEFIKKLIKCCVNTKRNEFKKLLNSQLLLADHFAPGDKSALPVATEFDFMGSFGNQVSNTPTNSPFVHSKFDFVDINNNKKKSNNEPCVTLPAQFLIECIFLIFLDFGDCLGTTTSIMNRLIDWFFEMRKARSQLKRAIESILCSTVFFKRVMNLTSKSPSNRPIILGKRQYVWSLNLNYLRPFVKHLFNVGQNKSASNGNDKCGDLIDKFECNFSSISIPVCLASTSNRLSSSMLDQNYSSNSFSELLPHWRLKLEKFEIFLQIKHNNHDFGWCDSRWLQSPTQSKDELRNRVDLTNGHKMASAIKAWKASKANVNKSNSIRKLTFAKSTKFANITNKKCVKKLIDENVNHMTKSFFNTKTQEDSFISGNLSTSLESNQFIRSDSISERNAPLEPSNPVSLMCQEESSHQMDSNSIAHTSYSSYFNMLTYCSSSSTYFQQGNEMNVVNLVEPNVDDLLNHSEDIEHDKFLYF